MNAALLSLALALTAAAEPQVGAAEPRVGAADPATAPPPSPSPAAIPSASPRTAPAVVPPAASTAPALKGSPGQVPGAAQPKPAPPAPAAAKPSPAPKPASKTVTPAAPAEAGHVAEGVIRFGQDIVLGSGQVVDGPVVAVGGSVTVDGPVEGPIIALGGFARLGPRAEVNGPVISFGGGTSVDPAAKVEGPVLDLPGARGVTRLVAPVISLIASLAALAVFGKLLAGLGWLVVGLVLWTLFPEALRNTRDTLERQTAACVVWGLFAVPALTAIAVAFVASLVGLPLLPLVGLVGAAGYVWGTVALAFWLGSRVGEGRWDSPLASILVGLLALKLLAFVPVVHWVVAVATLILALGAAFASRFGFRGPGLVTPVVPQ